MIGSWEAGQYLLRSINQILTAGMAITAFSLLLYTFQFNIRDKVTWTFTLILVSIVIAFSSEAIGSALTPVWGNDTWLRLEWLGIIILPPTYFHFSDALLAKTGKPSRGKRTIVNWLAYLTSFAFLLTLPFPFFFGAAILEEAPTPHLQITLVNALFVLFYAGLMAMAWFNFYRAFKRTRTPTSKRRMFYLVTSAFAPALGSFPYMLFGYGFASRHTLVFWLISILSNLLMGGLIIVMAYSVSFFGVSWPDRIVRSRLLSWILRGPVTAILVLGLSTAARRIGEYFGTPYSAIVPIVMATSLIFIQYLITMTLPFMEKWLINKDNEPEMDLVRSLETRFITDKDLRQFLETILAATCDQLQVPGAFIVTFEDENIELMVHIGEKRFDEEDFSEDLLTLVRQNGSTEKYYHWGENFLLPLQDHLEERNSEETTHHLLGLMCIFEAVSKTIDEEQKTALDLLLERASIALRDHYAQNKVLLSLQNIEPEVDFIHKIQLAGRLDERNLLLEEFDSNDDMFQWVKEALTHYWGGPKLTRSPLLDLQVVRDAVDENEGSRANALRAILKKAIDRVKPEGDRRFTAEWILYNILDMKFLEGRKVREIAMRLAVSEADLYRKQRVAIESVAKEIIDMEEKARSHPSN